MVETNVERARERVRAEREAVAAKRASHRTFRERVADLPVESGSATGVTATAGNRRTDGGGGCRAVRRAFAVTVGEHTDADATLAGVRESLGESLAVPLAPTTGATLTEGLRDGVLAASARRMAETGVLVGALDAEADALERASRTVQDVTDWIIAAEETPLTALGFDALAERHRTLTAHRERCAERLADRQAFLDGTTNDGVEIGVRHRSLVASLYEDCHDSYPVLTALARLDAACEECQHAVRDHLTRRA